MNEAIGLIEVVGLTQAIVAADECSKAASIKLLGIEKVSSGIVTVKISGDVGAVMAAVEAGKSIVEHSGVLRGYHVIPRLHEEVLCIVEGTKSKKDIEKNQMPKDKKTEELQGKIFNEVVEAMAEEVKIVIDDSNFNEVENVSDVKETKEEITKIEKSSKVKGNTEELTREKLLSLTVKELRQIAISTKVAKTWKEAKQLKKEDLIEKILK